MQEVKEKLVRVDSDVKPEDSISGAGTPMLSKVSRNSSRSSSGGSRAFTVALARAKEAAQVAVLRDEITILEKRQVLEERKLRLKQEETGLNLEAEIAKSTAKERALSAITSPG